MRAFCRYLRRYEPARVNALKVAVYGILAVLGVSVPAGVDKVVSGVIALVFACIALYYGERTRSRVTPVAGQVQR